MSANHKSLRRSGRERRGVETLYDEAARSVATSSRVSNEEDEDENDHVMVNAEEEEDEDEDEDEDEIGVGGGDETASSSSSSSDESDEEADPRRRPPRPAASRDGGPSPILKKNHQSSDPKNKSRASKPNQSRPSSSKASSRRVQVTFRAPASSRGRAPAASALRAVRRAVARPGEKRDDSLLLRLLDGDDADEICSEVVALHNADPNAAQCRLLNLLFRSIGGDLETNLDPSTTVLERLDNEEWARIVTDLVDRMRSTPADRILLSVDVLHRTGALGGAPDADAPTSLAARRGALYWPLFRDFWRALCRAALREGAMADADGRRLDVDSCRELVSRLTELVSVGQPDVRASATAAALSAGAAVLETSADLRTRIDAVRRHLSAASRGSGKAGGAKRKSLRYQLDGLERTLAETEELVTGPVLQGVFVHRYRDSHPFLRTVCLRSLSDYASSRPDLFLSDQYLKYFGWLLSDKDPNVRVAAADGLLAPVLQHRKNAKEGRVDDTLRRLEHVVSKFLPRMADLVIDVDPRVQEKAMELLLALLREGFLDDVEDEHIWNQINGRAVDANTTPAVRRDALYFIMEQLEAFDSNQDETPTTGKKKSKKNQQVSDPNSPVLSDHLVRARLDALASWLAHLLSDGPVPVHRVRVDLADLLVESLRSMPEHRRLVTDVNALLRAVSRDAAAVLDGAAAGDRADAVKQRVHARMLCVGAEREGPECGTALARALPDLLVAFRSDVAISARLAALPSKCLDAATASSPEVRVDVVRTVETLSACLLRETNDEVLKGLATSLDHMARGDHARVNDARRVLQGTVEELRARVLEGLGGPAARLAAKRRQAETEAAERRKRRRTGIDASSDTTTTSSDHAESKVEDDTIATMSTKEDAEHALYVNTKRLCALVKKHDVSSWLATAGEDEEDVDAGLVAFFDKLAAGMIERLDATDDAEKPSSCDPVAARFVDAGLNTLLALTAWRLRRLHQEEGHLVDDKDVLPEKEENDDDGEYEDHNPPHPVRLLRDRVVSVAEKCFERFVPEDDEDEDDETTAASSPRRAFADAVQAVAGRVASDLRVLFPRTWARAERPLLRSLALTADGRLVAGFVRFFRSREDALRDNEELDEENDEVVKALLLPLARGLVANWSVANRREAGVALAHMTGSGRRAAALVSTAAKIMKKTEPVRLLEAHMASLRQSYEDWIDNEPDELGDRPTDREMVAFTEAERNHTAQFQALEQQAARFSSSLGVGKLSDPKLVPALLGFVKEGIKYSFSNAEEGEDELILGSRLSFLAVLGKYVNWIRRNKNQRQEICRDLEIREHQLREHPEFEEVHEDDIAILGEFRVALGLKGVKKKPPTAVRVVHQEEDEDVDVGEIGDEVTEMTAGSTPNTDSRFSSRGGSLGTTPNTTLRSSTRGSLTSTTTPNTTLRSSTRGSLTTTTTPNTTLRSSTRGSQTTTTTTPNTTLSSGGKRTSRGSSLGSALSKQSSVRSELSPLREMERESSSPTSSGLTPDSRSRSTHVTGRTTRSGVTESSESRSTYATSRGGDQTRASSPGSRSQSTFGTRMQSTVGGGESVDSRITHSTRGGRSTVGGGSTVSKTQSTFVGETQSLVEEESSSEEEDSGMESGYTDLFGGVVASRK